MVDPSEEEELEGGKSSCNFHLKWEGAKKAAYCSFANPKCLKSQYTAEDSGTWVPIAAWDCRGLEPVKWHPQGNFTAEGTTGCEFEDINLGDEDGFADYDEDADMPVSIMELEWKLEAVSAK
eukprot:TRINITY_DN1410_c0_g1_i3.p1 TRINITY_DN1410_c0_g1~~TRINITY_DN1410_c0_g1_i3.p1  ORF type:complete len:122 (+),score=36.64 TRINITY_DN1410_c0_g1_i3:167-532(+)